MLLKKNNANRPLSKSTLERYKKAIKRGEWKLNGEAIIIFLNGNIGDGQHRCQAVVDTGITIRTLIVTGVDENVFSTIDSGKMRNASDVLSIKGEINTIRLAAATRTYLATELSGRELSNITSVQIENCLDLHPEIRFWVQKFSSIKNNLTFLPGSFCGYMAIASEKHGREKLDKFLNQLATGASLEAKSPALVLRNRLMAQTSVKRLNKILMEAFIVKAINACLTGKEMAILRHTENEDFPKIV